MDLFTLLEEIFIPLVFSQHNSFNTKYSTQSYSLHAKLLGFMLFILTFFHMIWYKRLPLWCNSKRMGKYIV